MILPGALRAESTKPRLRIGQIGTVHAHAAGKMAMVKKSADFEVVGIVEPDERLRRAAEKNRAYDGVRWMTEAELLATPGLRAVVVETEGQTLRIGTDRTLGLLHGGSEFFQGLYDRVADIASNVRVSSVF